MIKIFSSGDLNITIDNETINTKNGCRYKKAEDLEN